MVCYMKCVRRFSTVRFIDFELEISMTSETSRLHLSQRCGTTHAGATSDRHLRCLLDRDADHKLCHSIVPLNVFSGTHCVYLCWPCSCNRTKCAALRRPTDRTELLWYSPPSWGVCASVYMCVFLCTEKQMFSNVLVRLALVAPRSHHEHRQCLCGALRSSGPNNNNIIT